MELEQINKEKKCPCCKKHILKYWKEYGRKNCEDPDKDNPIALLFRLRNNGFDYRCDNCEALFKLKEENA